MTETAKHDDDESLLEKVKGFFSSDESEAERTESDFSEESDQEPVVEPLLESDNDADTGTNTFANEDGWIPPEHDTPQDRPVDTTVL